MMRTSGEKQIFVMETSYFYSSGMIYSRRRGEGEKEAFFFGFGSDAS